MKFIVLCDWPGMSSYYNEILTGIEQYCKGADISVLTLSVGIWDSEEQADKSKYYLYRQLSQNEYDGIISYTSSISKYAGVNRYYSYIRSLSNAPIINLIADVDGGYSVVADNSIAFSELLHHLCDFHGYRDFAYITGTLANPEGQGRLDMVHKVLGEYGVQLPAERIYIGEWNYETGAVGYDEFSADLPRVIICANDYIAQGVAGEAQKAGVQIPQELVLTGFDNVSPDGIHDLPFTTIKQPFIHLGYTAAEKLTRILDGCKVPKSTIVPAKFIIKESCGCWYQLDNEAGDHSADKLLILQTAQNDMLNSFDQDIEHPDGNYLIRTWNAIMQQFIKIKLAEHEVWAFLNDLVRLWQQKYSDPEILGRMNWQLTRLEKIISDNLNQYLTTVTHQMSEMSANAHILCDQFNERVISSVSLKNRAQDLVRLFTSLRKQNAAVIFLKESDDPGVGFLGSVYFAMQNGIINHEIIGRDIDLSAEFLPDGLICDGYGSYIVQTLFYLEEILGLLIYDYASDQTELDEYICRSLSSTLKVLRTNQALQLKNMSLEHEIALRIESENRIQALLDTLKNLSVRDPLTSLFNRRGFMTVWEQQIKQFIRDSENFLVVFFDMDNLKIINDNYGHHEGDVAIIAMAEVLSRSFRDSDIVARLGGDEFTVLLGAAETNHLSIIENRLENNTSLINSELEKPYDISFSYGFCSYSDTDNANLTEMLEQADRAQYAQKNRKKGIE